MYNSPQAEGNIHLAEEESTLLMLNNIHFPSRTLSVLLLLGKVQGTNWRLRELRRGSRKDAAQHADNLSFWGF